MLEMTRRPAALAIFRSGSFVSVMTSVVLVTCVATVGQWTPPSDKPPFHHGSNASKGSGSPTNGTPTNNLRSTTLVVLCKVDCTISIDHGWRLPLFAGRRRPFSLTVGTHSIFVRGAGGQSRLQTTLVLQKGVRRDLVVPLTPQHPHGIVASNNERNEIVVQIARVREQIEANRRTATEIQAQRARLLEEQQARNAYRAELQQRAEAIVGQIRSYEAQVEQEFAQATQDENDAQQSYNLSLLGSSQNTVLGKIAGVTGAATFTAKRVSAQRHRERAQQLTAEMDRLSRELYVLTKPQ